MNMVKEIWTDGWFGKSILLIIAIFCLGGVVATVHEVFPETFFNAPNAGFVREKYYNPPSVTTSYIYTNNMMMPVTTSNPAFWSIKIENRDGRTWTYKVSQESWLKLKKGDYWQR